MGEDNFFLFGLKEAEVEDLRSHYDPQAHINTDPDLQAVMQLLESGHFNPCDPGIFDDLIFSLKNPGDPWMTLADFRCYIEAQHQVSNAYQDREGWIRKSILNTANSGFFSTDRTMQEYNRDIWKLEPVKFS